MLIQTKLRRPTAPPDLVERPRLRRAMDEAARHRVSLVCAPAGFGKTTLVADWLEQSAYRTAWLSLDRMDRDQRRFIEYLVASVRSQDPSGLADTEAILAAGSAGMDAVEASSLGEISRLQSDLVLVLEDYHTVSGSDIDAFVERLVHYLPDGVRLIIVTRKEPAGLPLTQWMVRGWLAELSAGQLTFTRQEASDFLFRNETFVDTGLADLAFEAVGGWAAGLRLIRLTNRAPSTGSHVTDSVVDADPSLGAAQELLRSEVLDELPRDMLTLLAVTTLTSRFCAELCEFVLADTGIDHEDVRGLMGDVVLRDLFLIRLDDEGRWFGHHELFRAAAQQHAERTLGAEVIGHLSGRAARWFAEHGHTEEALRLWLETDQVDRAAEVLGQRLSAELVADLSRRRLQRWLGLFPRGAERGNIPLLVAGAAVDLAQWNLDGIRRSVEEARVLMEHPRTRERHAQFLPMIDAVESFERFWRGEPEEARRLAERALEQTGLTADGWAWTGGVYMLSHSLAALGRAEEAQKLLETWETADVARGSPFIGNILVTRATVDLADGNAEGAAHHASRLLSVGRSMEVSEHWRGCAEYALGVASYERNDLDAAERHFAALGRLMGRMPARVFHSGLVGRAVTALARRDQTAAQRHLAASLDFALRMHDPGSKAISESLALRIDSAGDARAVPPPIADISMIGPWLEYPPVTHARWLAREQPHASEECLSYIDHVVETARRFHNTRVAIAIEFVRGIVLHEAGRREEADSVMTAALEKARARRMVRTVLDTGPTVAPILERLDLAGRLAEYRNELVAASTAEGWEASARPLPTLTRREHDVSALLSQRLSNAEIAERLFISSETVKSHLRSIYRKLGVRNRREALDVIRTRSQSG